VEPGPAKAGSHVLLEAYLEHLSRERRLSAHTRRNYEHACKSLLALNPGVEVTHLEVHAVRRTIAQLHAHGLSGRTLAAMLSAWRGWYRWLARYRGCTANPCANLKPPKSPKRLPEALSADEAARLLDDPAQGVAEIRDKAMFELFYSSGLRLAELVALDTPHARDMIAAAEVTVIGKGRKSRTVPVGAKALGALKAWMEARALLAKPGEPALFTGSRGSRISPRVVQERLVRWAKKCALARGVHPHVLRHSFASHLLQSSGDLRAVQEMLGHASISTTQVYTHLDFQYLAKAYDAAHPRARRKPK
jgi:integrase/recombinase XerC